MKVWIKCRLVHHSPKRSSPTRNTGIDAMQTGYYAFVIAQDGHIKDRITLLCDNDEKAKEQAKHLVDGHAVELWQEKRRLAVFAPDEQ